MRFLTSEVAGATGGHLVGPDVPVEGASVDSRDLVAGQLFVAVEAERDGHAFAAAAVAAGAPACLVRRPVEGATSVVVQDTGAALTDLGRTARLRLPDRVVGVTGSVGKTSVKDLLAATLTTTWRTAASPRSFNNELGVPLTLVDAPDGTEAAVIEMGSRGRGHVRALCAIARPTVGVVTAVAPAHTEMLGSLDEIAEAKSELVEELPPGGTAVLNGADERVARMAGRTAATVLRCGGAEADLRAEEVALDADLHPSFRLRSPWGEIEVRLTLSGRHHVSNAVLAAGAALACGVSLADVAEGLGRATASSWRMDVRRSPTGLLVVNDAYNANPASMAAALDALDELAADRRVAFLGTMAELGATSGEQHRAVAERAASAGVQLVAVAEPEYGDGSGIVHVGDVAEALATARELDLGRGDVALVKGSRCAGLEVLAAALLDGQPAD